MKKYLFFTLTIAFSIFSLAATPSCNVKMFSVARVFARDILNLPGYRIEINYSQTNEFLANIDNVVNLAITTESEEECNVTKVEVLKQQNK